MRLKLVSWFILFATANLAQSSVTVGYQPGDSGPYPWRNFATGPVVLAGTPPAYAFASNPLTFSVAISEPGAVSGTFDVTLSASTTVAGMSAQLTEYAGRLGVDRSGTSSGADERNISQNEFVTVAISHVSLQSLDGVPRELRLSSVSTYGLDETESLVISKNGAAMVTVGSGLGTNNATAASFALEDPLAQAADGDAYTISLTGPASMVFRLESLTFSTVAAPQARLESPVGGYGNAGLHPNFLWRSGAWGGVAQADAYEIQIATDDLFTAPLVDDTVPIARFVPADTRLNPGASYYWRVRCLDDGVAGDWSETGAFSVADFNHYVTTVDGSATVAQVRSAFARAKQNAPATVRLTSDVTWASTDDDIFNLTGYNNVWFDGAGHSITVTNPANRLFHIFNSSNFIFSDFSVDYDPLPYVLCEVASLDRASNQLIVRTIHNAANPTLELNDPALLAADHTHMRLLDPAHPGRIKVGFETYILDGDQSYVGSFEDQGTLYHRIQLNRNAYTTDDFAVGDLMLRFARWDGRNTVRTVNGTEVCLDGVTAFASPSQLVNSVDGSALSVLHCQVVPKPGRYNSVTADVVYARRNEIGPWVQNCSFLANGDDCMNFHSIAARIERKVDDRTVQLAGASDFNRMAVGDEVAIWDPYPGTTAPVYTTIVARDAALSTITTAASVGTISLNDTNSAKNSGVYNLTKNNRRFYVKGNLIRDNARYGMLISSQDGAVVDNAFVGCASSAIAIGNNPSEGLNARNLLIARNAIADCGYSGSFFEDHFGAIRVNSYGTTWIEVPFQFHDNLRFIDNVISGWNGTAFRLQGASRVLLQDNTILAGTADSFLPLADANNLISLSNVTDVRILGTHVDDPRPYDAQLRDEGGVTGLQVEPFAEAVAITSQPSAVSVPAFQPASFTVAVRGSPPFAFQWRRNGQPIPGGDQATLTIASARAADAGQYDVVIGNAYGSVTSIPAILAVAKVPATVALGDLAQSYDGRPRPVSAATDPAGLNVLLRYDGRDETPVFPGRYEVAAAIDDPDYVGAAVATLTISPAALINHAPTLHGSVIGSLQLRTAENVVLNSQATLAGDLLVPGTPTVTYHGSPEFSGVIDAAGAADPQSYKITINSGVTLGRVVRRLDPAPALVLPALGVPAGTRSVVINRPGDDMGDLATLKNLTLNGGAGSYALPPGGYGRVIVNQAAELIFGVEGSATPVIYELQSLTLNGGGSLRIVGPVVLRLGSSLTLSSALGSAGAPEWLVLQLPAGDVTLNAGAQVRGKIQAPAGRVTVNQDSLVFGEIVADSLTINAGGGLEQPGLYESASAIDLTALIRIRAQQADAIATGAIYQSSQPWPEHRRPADPNRIAEHGLPAGYACVAIRGGVAKGTE